MAKERPTNKDSIQGGDVLDQEWLYVGRKVLCSLMALKESVNRNINEKTITVYIDFSRKTPLESSDFNFGGPHNFSLPVEELRKHPQAFEKFEKQILELLRLVRKRFPSTDPPVDFEMGMNSLKYQIREFEKLVAIHQAAVSGAKVKKGGIDGGLNRGRQQTTAREKEWAKWQAEAEKIWKKRPTWGNLAVAKEVHKKYPDCAKDTIRKRIKKPTL